MAFKVSTHPTNRNTVAIKRDVMFLRFHDSADEFFHCYILFLVNFLLSMWFAMLALKYKATDKVDCYKATNKKLPYKESCDIFNYSCFAIE